MIAVDAEGCKTLEDTLRSQSLMLWSCEIGRWMFWKKKKATLSEQRQETPVPVNVTPRSKQDELEDAAKKLAASLRSYADASYAAHQPPPDDELKAAHRKVEIARKVVSEGRILEDTELLPQKVP